MFLNLFMRMKDTFEWSWGYDRGRTKDRNISYDGIENMLLFDVEMGDCETYPSDGSS